jgi:periplasmic divalent cation tolerance protein
MRSGRAFLVLTTTRSPAQARRLARRLLEKRSAACVTLVPGVRSLYWWKKRIEESGETLLLIKTRQPRLSGLFRQIKALHPYEVPEILALPVSRGDSAYLRWLEESLMISV